MMQFHRAGSNWMLCFLCDFSSQQGWVPLKCRESPHNFIYVIPPPTTQADLASLTQYFDPCKLHVLSPSIVGGLPSRAGRWEHIKAGTHMPMLPGTIQGPLICLLNYISSQSRLESPLSPRAIDTLALPRLTRGFVCCGQHSRLSPDGIYYVLCFNIHSVWVEINFSFGPNCLCAVAAQGSAALEPRLPPVLRVHPTLHTAVFYT